MPAPLRVATSEAVGGTARHAISQPIRHGLSEINAQLPDQQFVTFTQTSRLPESVTEQLLPGRPMRDIFEIVRERRVPEKNLHRILEAARWAPTAHNMWNFEIVAVNAETGLTAIAATSPEVSEKPAAELRRVDRTPKHGSEPLRSTE